jgi:hypothetical protein
MSESWHADCLSEFTSLNFLPCFFADHFENYDEKVTTLTAFVNNHFALFYALF